jgi:hypothetical protein
MEAEVKANNAFVKKVQTEQAKWAGRAPKLMPDAMKTDAVQVNTGAHADRLARALTRDLDKKAFPVK